MGCGDHVEIEWWFHHERKNSIRIVGQGGGGGGECGGEESRVDLGRAGHALGSELSRGA